MTLKPIVNNINNFSHLRCSLDITTNCAPGDPIPPSRVDTTDRLVALRDAMTEEDVQAYIVPLDEEGRRQWISGFSGSNGDAIVTADQVKARLT
jgi:hypothetical protein